MIAFLIYYVEIGLYICETLRWVNAAWGIYNHLNPNKNSWPHRIVKSVSSIFNEIEHQVYKFATSINVFLSLRIIAEGLKTINEFVNKSPVRFFYKFSAQQLMFALVCSDLIWKLYNKIHDNYKCDLEQKVFLIKEISKVAPPVQNIPNNESQVKIEAVPSSQAWYYSAITMLPMMLIGMVITISKFGFLSKNFASKMFGNLLTFIFPKIAYENKLNNLNDELNRQASAHQLPNDKAKLSELASYASQNDVSWTEKFISKTNDFCYAYLEGLNIGYSYASKIDAQTKQTKLVRI